jgi:hypothetical protein
MVNETGDRFLEAALVPARVPGGAEENRTLIVVEPVNGETLLMQKQTHLRANQTGGASNADDLRCIAMKSPLTSSLEILSMAVVNAIEEHENQNIRRTSSRRTLIEAHKDDKRYVPETRKHSSRSR